MGKMKKKEVSKKCNDIKEVVGRYFQASDSGREKILDQARKTKRLAD